jgi:hypothetical protein
MMSANWLVTTASHAAWAVIAGCGLVVLVLGMISTGRWARGTAARNGERLAARAQEKMSPGLSARAAR